MWQDHLQWCHGHPLGHDERRACRGQECNQPCSMYSCLMNNAAYLLPLLSTFCPSLSTQNDTRPKIADLPLAAEKDSEPSRNKYRVCKHIQSKKIGVCCWLILIPTRWVHNIGFFQIEGLFYLLHHKAKVEEKVSTKNIRKTKSKEKKKESNKKKREKTSVFLGFPHRYWSAVWFYKRKNTTVTLTQQTNSWTQTKECVAPVESKASLQANPNPNSKITKTKEIGRERDTHTHRTEIRLLQKKIT